MLDFESTRGLALAVVFGPLLGAIAAGVLGPRVLRAGTHFAAILGVGVAFAASVILLLRLQGASADQSSIVIPLFDWIAGAREPLVRAALLIDRLTGVMLVTVTGISLLVVIYSRDYMRDHGHAVRGYERFFAFLALFVFSMCMLVLGGNFVLLYLGWEAVGLCSYLLIGFYYEKPSAAAAANKAFIVNRIGDFGFGLGLLLIYLTFGTWEYGPVFEMVQRGVTATGAAVGQGTLTAIALLLLCGACGKSAQFPLHVWLPDAMEGPSPVSALIHAATMVTAGIYMIARCGAIFTSSATAMSIVAGIGAFTALMAATIAIVQTDVKRILAYSTISQLGYMVLGIGVFAADSALFHLFTHAFFKALLFLAAGSVMHAMGGVIDFRNFGGLKKVLPWTFSLFLVGSLALAGFPLLSGFFSKDEIIHHALQANKLLGGMAIVTAALTAFYTFRMFFRTFSGPLRTPPGVHAHESGGWMIFSMAVLALGALFAGYAGTHITGQPFHKSLEPVFASTFLTANPFHASHGAATAHGGFLGEYGLMILSGAIALLGILAAYVLYVQQPWIPGLIRATFTKTYEFLWRKYELDEAYDVVVVTPLRGLGRFFVGWDDYFIDGLIWIVTVVPRAAAFGLRAFQSGFLQSYALTMVAGLVIIVLLAAWN